MGIGCVNECGRTAWKRGCCPACYGRLAESVRQGKSTWERLEKLGKCLPRGKRVRVK